MTIVKVCRDANTRFENRTGKHLKYYNKESKFCCRYCDKKIVHKDRLKDHEGKCQITCFNFLHKMESGKLQGKIFTETLPVYFKGEKLPMNEIEICPINQIMDLDNNELELVELLDIDPIIPPLELIQIIDNDVSPLNKPTKPKKKVISCVIKDADIVVKPESVKISPPVYNDPSDLNIGDIIEYDSFEDKLSEPYEIDLKSEIEHLTKCHQENIPFTLCNDIYNSPNISEMNDNMSNVNIDNLDYDKHDEDMCKIINNELCSILKLINDNRNDELLYYKSKIKDDYNDILYLQIVPQLDKEYMVDIVTDFNDIDFIKYKQIEYNNKYNPYDNLGT